MPGEWGKLSSDPNPFVLFHMYIYERDFAGGMGWDGMKGESMGSDPNYIGHLGPGVRVYR